MQHANSYEHTHVHTHAHSTSQSRVVPVGMIRTEVLLLGVAGVDESVVESTCDV